MMLQATVVVLLVSAVTSQTSMEADVLILGAGKAGMTAAKELHDKSVSFLVIEAASDIGGRIKSEMFGGRMVELGPDGFYDTQERINATVEMYNVIGKYLDYESVVVRTSTGTTPESESEAAWERLAESQKKVKELYEKIKDGEIPDMSIRVALEYGNWFPKTPVDDVIEIYDYDYEFSKVPALISTKSFEGAEFAQISPFMSTDPRGMEGLFKIWASEFLNETDPRLKLNEEVTNITYTGSSVSVSTKGGNTFTGKYAIITFSMGVLKSGSVTFDPPLPEWKLDTIYRTSMDSYVHIYVKFASGAQKFWENEQFILYASPRRGYYPIIWNMVADGFYPAEAKMFSFGIMGKEARRIERSDKAAVKAEITDVLRKMYGPSTPEPEDILVTKWLDDPLTMGSFSSRQVGNNNPRFMDALTSPVGRLYFAGEAYHDVLDGFTEGARLSAVTTAMKLHDCMANNKCHQFDPNPPKPAPPTCGAARHYTVLTCIASVVLLLYIF